MIWMVLAGCWEGEGAPLMFPIEAPCVRIGQTLSEVLVDEAAWSPGDGSTDTRVELVRHRGEATLTVTHTGEQDDSVSATSVVYELSSEGEELRVKACRTSVACARSVLPPCD